MSLVDPIDLAAPAEPVPRADVERLRASAADATAMLRLLANEDRLLLLCQLSQGERCVSELEQQLDIRQPTLSQQLAVLRQHGVVATRREGKHIHYRVSDERVLALLDQLYQLFCQSAGETTP